MIELIHASLPDFTTETQLVPADVVGNDIGEHSGYIVAAFRRRNADLLKTGDGNIRGAQDGLSLDGRVRAEVQAQRLGIEAIVGVAESLVEVVDSEQQLIRHPRGENGVQRGCIVVWELFRSSTADSSWPFPERGCCPWERSDCPVPQTSGRKDGAYR